jgi:hypothetical protein
MNRHVRPGIVARMTTARCDYPTRVDIVFCAIAAGWRSTGSALSTSPVSSPPAPPRSRRPQGHGRASQYVGLGVTASTCAESIRQPQAPFIWPLLLDVGLLIRQNWTHMARTSLAQNDGRS